METKLFEIIKKAESTGHLPGLKKWALDRISVNKQLLLPKLAAKRSTYIQPVLDGLQQQQNGSAIMRTADALGFQSVSIVDDRPYSIKKNISKGTDKWLTVNRYHGEEAASQCLQNLRKQGYRIAVASTAPEAVLVNDAPLDSRLAIVLGSEVEGVSEFWNKNADMHIYQPMYGFAQSLNVSVAWGILGAKLRSRLESSKIDFLEPKEEQEKLIIYWALKTIPYGELMVKDFINY